MATKLEKIETLPEAKERVKKAFRPSDEDPVVRFIENGKMGLRHLMSEAVVEAPTKDFIDMPEAEEVTQLLSASDIYLKNEAMAMKHLPAGYKIPYIQDMNKVLTPFTDFIRVNDADKHWGVIDMQGKIVVPAIYDNMFVEAWFDKKTHTMRYFSNVYGTKKDGKYGYVAFDGREVVPNTYENYKEAFKAAPGQGVVVSDAPEWACEKDMFTYYDDQSRKYGLKNLKGKTVTEAIYNTVGGQYWVGDCHLFEVRNKEYGDDIAGLVDQTGKVILPCDYYKDDLRVEKNGLIFARKKKKQGVFSLDGKVIVKCAYGYCRLEEGNVISAETSKDMSLFNTLGQVIIDKGIYEKVIPAKDGLIEVRDIENGNWWYIDLWGNRMPEK